ncbi:MAG TPA: glycoside hydrolase family 3 protein [Thermomicrobiales bacterium]|nr:glycoside hydrolase family 3 protein [Thermomicrobiales bacterium]
MSAHPTPLPADDAALGRLAASLSPEEQVGQLIVAYVPGTTLDADTAAFLRDCHVGGVVLLGDNIATPAETRALTAALDAACRAGNRAGLPATIAADQEGGRVQRLKPPATSFPSAMALGATGSAEHARHWGLATARELRALGLTMDYAPVLDVNDNPLNPVIGTRAYGERADEVARLGLAACAGLREAGCLATVKHFPGHGDTHVDSHFGLPTVPHGWARLDAVELAPFRAAIAAGVPAVMTTHIVFPALDPDLPATLSRAVLTGLLRGELGFGGAIVSDAMEMQAIADRFGVVAGAVQFIAAGGDLLLGVREVRAVYAALLAAVANGDISRDHLAASVGRVLRLKRWAAAQPPADPAWLGAPEHGAWAAAIARDALTLLRDDARLLPLGRDARLAVLDCAYQWTFRADMERPASSALADALRPHFPHTDGVVVDGRDPTPADLAAARAAVADADVAIVGTRSTRRFPAQAALVEAALGWGKPVVAVALNEPYDLMAYPAAQTALATYGATPEMLAALAAALAGEEAPRGRLPVSLPGLYEVGHGV